jgi:hypothetical protein
VRKSQEQKAQEEAARIIHLATQIMAKGARGWSDALSQAKKQVRG